KFVGKIQLPIEFYNLIRKCFHLIFLFPINSNNAQSRENLRSRLFDHSQVNDFLFGKIAPMSTWQVLLGESGINYPIEFYHLIFQFLKNTLYDLITGTPKFYPHFIFWGILYKTNIIYPDHIIIDCDTVLYLL